MIKIQGTPALPMPMGYEQFQPPSSNLNANNSKKIKIENDQNISIGMVFGHQFTHDQNMRFRLTKNNLQIQKSCVRRNTSAS
jgi:hypothetical protein